MMRKQNSRQTPVKEAAETFGVTVRTINGWIAHRNCPATKRSGKNYVDESEVAAWMKDEGLTGSAGRPKGDETIDAAKLRKELAMAENWEIRNQKEMEKLVETEAVRQRWTEIGSKIRTRFQSFATEVSPRLYGQEPHMIEKVLNDGIDAILAELGGGKD